MELFYNTEVGRFEQYLEATLGTMGYLVYWRVGQKWATDGVFIEEEVLEDALVMGVLRPATEAEVRSLGL